MNRRTFLSALTGSLLAAPLAAGAQAGKAARVGYLFSEAVTPESFEAFRKGLRELGWTEGHNVRFDYRWGAGGADRIRSYVASRRCFLPAHQVIE